MTTGLNRWTFVAIALAVPTLAVLCVLFFGLFATDANYMPHMWQYVLPIVIPNTLALLVLVTLGTTLIGVVCAALVVFFEFPGRRFFQWVLLLPLAFPGYVLAFIYLGLFDYASPLQKFLRTTLSIDLSGAWSSPLPGVAFVLILALYPYVYLLARSGFASQGCRAFEVASSCQMNYRQAFIKAILPLSLPWIGAGALLVAMETLADFGVVAVFNFDTFTTAIYKAWFGLFSLSGALRLASILLVIVMVLVLIERHFAKQKNRSLKNLGAVRKRRLHGSSAILATSFLTVLMLLGFLIPAIQLLIWAFGAGIHEWQTGFVSLMRSSITFGLLGTLVVVSVMALMVGALRQNQHRLSQLSLRLSGLGYALPGAVLAVGVFVVLSLVDRMIISTFSIDTGQLLGASVLVTLLAYLVRFAAVALGPLENGMLRLPTSLDHSSKLMGISGLRMLLTLHWPLLKLSVLTAALLVFVDILKEMPITLMTRPFGWDTLAVRVYERTAEGQWAEAAPAALLIVMVGLVPIIFLTRKIEDAITHR